MTSNGSKKGSRYIYIYWSTPSFLRLFDSWWTMMTVPLTSSLQWKTYIKITHLHGEIHNMHTYIIPINTHIYIFYIYIFRWSCNKLSMLADCYAHDHLVMPKNVFFFFRLRPGILSTSFHGSWLHTNLWTKKLEVGWSCIIYIGYNIISWFTSNYDSFCHDFPFLLVLFSDFSYIGDSR